MNEIEAISVLETRIKYPNSDTYGDMCESEYQQEAVDIAREALREQAERSKGCEYCKPLFTGGTNARLLDSNAVFCSRCGKRLEVEP